MLRTTTLTALLLVGALLAAGATVGAAHSPSDALGDATASSLDDPNESNSADTPFRRVGDVPAPGDGAPDQSGSSVDPAADRDSGDGSEEAPDDERERSDDGDDEDGDDSDDGEDRDDADDTEDSDGGDGATERTRFYSNAPVNESCPTVDGYHVERVDADEADTDLEGGENGEVCVYVPEEDTDGDDDTDDTSAGDERRDGENNETRDDRSENETREDGAPEERLEFANAPAGEDCAERDGYAVHRVSEDRVEERLGRDVDGGENGEVCAYLPVDGDDDGDRTRDDGEVPDGLEIENAPAGEDCEARDGYHVRRMAADRVEERLGRDVDGGENGEVCVYVPEDEVNDDRDGDRVAPEDIQVTNAPAGESCETRDSHAVRRMTEERVEERLGRDVDGGENGEVCVYVPMNDSEDDRTGDRDGERVAPEEIDVENAPAGEDCAERDGYHVERASEEGVEEELGRDVDGGENGEVCLYFPVDDSGDNRTGDRDGDRVAPEDVQVTNAPAGESCEERSGYAVDRASEERVEEELGRDVDGGENGEVCLYFPSDDTTDDTTTDDTTDDSTTDDTTDDIAVTNAPVGEPCEERDGYQVERASEERVEDELGRDVDGGENGDVCVYFPTDQSVGALHHGGDVVGAQDLSAGWVTGVAAVRTN